MSEVNDRIDAVLENRRRLLPEINAQIDRWERARTLLGRIGGAVSSINDSGEQAAAVIATVGPDVGALDHEVADVLATLAAVRARVSRQTINIGVSGRARNGKSTLLQSLTGLGDQQIPAGAGQPVTAVRSRIFNSSELNEAVLTMHTEASFCTEVLGGYHEELQLSGVPRSIDEFARTTYPASSAELNVGPEMQPELAPLLARIRETQDSLASFRQYLDGRTQRVGLDDLREWVAYPPLGPGEPDRRYLAVRDARISCRFPVDDVKNLGCLDLPGLGESTPRAEAHHLAGLQNDVDFVLVVKRPGQQNAVWLKEDARGLGLIARAAGAADVSDFVAIIVNDGQLDQVNVDALLADIDKRVNEGSGTPTFRRIVADAADPESVRKEVLLPVLAHLAEALPRMDAAVIDDAAAKSQALARRLLDVTGAMSAALRTVLTPTALEELLKRSLQLQSQLAASVQQWIEGLADKAADGYEDAEFLEHAQKLQDSVRAWVLDGFGEGVPGWTDRALDGMRRQRGSTRFALDEVDRIRVEIARRFAKIDELLEQRRAQFWADLVTALGPALVPPRDDGDARLALQQFAVRLREIPNPCPSLADSIDFVLDVRLDYRTRLLPRMRLALAALRPEQSSDGIQVSALNAPVSAEGAAELFTQISHLARQSTHDAGQLLAAEPGTMAQVLLAFAEQFEDSFIRSGTSDDEFRRLAEAFRDQLWPAEPSGPALATARVQHLRRLLHDLCATLDDDAARPRERKQQW